MGFIALWIGMSALVGFLGRRRRGGFWALFFFSLVLSPIVGTFSLLLTRPRPRTIVRPKALRPGERAVFVVPVETHWLVAVLPRVTFGTLLVVWLAIVVVFGTMYWRMAPALDTTGKRVNFTLAQGLQLSLDVATLGFHTATIEDMPRVPLALERLAVLLLLVLMVARLALRNPASEINQLRRVAASRGDRLRAIEQALARQQQVVDALRTHVEAQRATSSEAPDGNSFAFRDARP